MVLLTVNLTPPLSGAQGKLYLVYGDNTYPIIDLPFSQEGIITTSIAVSSPQLDYAVILPEQTINGVKYYETMSTLFHLVSNVTISMTLESETPPPPPPPPAGEVNIAIPVIVSIVTILAAVRL